MKKGGRAQEAALPTPPPRGLAQVFNLRFWSGASSTRVVLDVEKAVRYKYDRIRDPDRLWVDLEGTRLHPNLLGRIFPVGDGLLEKIRVGQNRDSVVRVVLDFRDVKDHTIFYLENPTRLVVDVRGTAAAPPAVIAGHTPAPRWPRTRPPSRSTSPRSRGPRRPPRRPRRFPSGRWRRLDVPRLPPPPVPNPVILRPPVPFEGPPQRAGSAPSPAPWPSADAGDARRAWPAPLRDGGAGGPPGQPRRLLQPRPPARPGRAQDRHRRRPRRARSRNPRPRRAPGEGHRARRRRPPAAPRARRAAGGGGDDARHGCLRPPRGAHRHRQRAGGGPVPLHPRQQQPQPAARAGSRPIS